MFEEQKIFLKPETPMISLVISKKQSSGEGKRIPLEMKITEKIKQK